jgi:hypothetical protein
MYEGVGRDAPSGRKHATLYRDGRRELLIKNEEKK